MEGECAGWLKRMSLQVVGERVDGLLALQRRSSQNQEEKIFERREAVWESPRCREPFFDRGCADAVSPQQHPTLLRPPRRMAHDLEWNQGQWKVVMLSSGERFQRGSRGRPASCFACREIQTGDE